MKAEHTNVKSKCYQKIKLQNYGMFGARLDTKYQQSTGQACSSDTENALYLFFPSFSSR